MLIFVKSEKNNLILGMEIGTVQLGCEKTTLISNYFREIDLIYPTKRVLRKIKGESQHHKTIYKHLTIQKARIDKRKISVLLPGARIKCDSNCGKRRKTREMNPIFASKKELVEKQKPLNRGDKVFTSTNQPPNGNHNVADSKEKHTNSG